MSTLGNIFNPVWRKLRGIRDIVLNDAKLQADLQALETAFILAVVESLTTLLERLVAELTARRRALSSLTKARLGALGEVRK